MSLQLGMATAEQSCETARTTHHADARPTARTLSLNSPYGCDQTLCLCAGALSARARLSLTRAWHGTRAKSRPAQHRTWRTDADVALSHAALSHSLMHAPKHGTCTAFAHACMAHTYALHNSYACLHVQLACVVRIHARVHD